MTFLPYETIYLAGLHYLFGLPLTTCLLPDEAMLWVNYASISNFNLIPKNTTTKLKKKQWQPNLARYEIFPTATVRATVAKQSFLEPGTN